MKGEGARCMSRETLAVLLSPPRTARLLLKQFDRYALHVRAHGHLELGRQPNSALVQCISQWWAAAMYTWHAV